VVLGTVIAVIGGGLIVTLFAFVGGPTNTSQLTFENPALTPHTVLTEVIVPSTTATASVGLSWTTSAPANVTLTPATPCATAPGACPTGPPVFNWTLSVTGKGTDSSASASAYILEVANPQNGPIKFSAVVSVGYHPGGALPAWAWGLIGLGGVALLAIGGISVFLGFFLPGGVYSGSEEGPELTYPPDYVPDNPDDDPVPPS